MFHPKRAARSGVVLLVVLVAACSAAPQASDGLPKRADEAAHKPMQPIDVVLQTNRFLDESSSYQLAEDRAMARCMANAGFAEPLRAAEEVSRLHELGEPNLAWRAEEGFGLAPVSDAQAPDPATAEALGAAAFGEPEVWVAGLDQGNGLGAGLISVGGCRGEAIAATYGDVDTFLLLAEGVLRPYNAMLEGFVSAAWEAGEARWIDCMAARGYDHQAQGNTYSVFQLRYATEPVTEQLREDERRAAVDDGECLYESGLVDAKREQAERYLASLDAEGLAEVDAILAAHRDAYAAAPALIAEIEAELGDG